MFLHHAQENISISDWIQISISLFTFLAIIVALFGEKIRLWLFGPKIVVEFDKNNERCFRWALVAKDNIQDQEENFFNLKRQYFRLRVSNNGLMVAHNLKAKIELYFPNKTFADRFEPSNLQWVSGLQIIDLAPKEDEYLNLISQVIQPGIKGYRLRVEIANKVHRGIAWDRTFASWILKIAVHGENISPIVRFFRFDPIEDENQPGNLTEIDGL